MPSAEPGMMEALEAAASTLAGALGRLSTLQGACLGVLAGMEGVGLWRGLASVPLLLSAAVLMAAGGCALAWQAAWRRVRAWVVAVDRRLGPGTGLALLALGRRKRGQVRVLQGPAAVVEGAREGDPLPCLPVGPGRERWAAPLLLAALACLPFASPLRVAAAALGAALAWGAWGLGSEAPNP
jgi:hypothetical protein